MAPNSTSTALSMYAKTCRRMESSESVMSALLGPLALLVGGGARLGQRHGGAVGEEAGAVGGDHVAGAQALRHFLQAVLAHPGLDHALARDAFLHDVDDLAGGAQHHALLRHHEGAV